MFDYSVIAEDGHGDTIVVVDDVDVNTAYEYAARHDNRYYNVRVQRHLSDDSIVMYSKGIMVRVCGVIMSIMCVLGALYVQSISTTSTWAWARMCAVPFMLVCVVGAVVGVVVACTGDTQA